MTKNLMRRMPAVAAFAVAAFVGACTVVEGPPPPGPGPGFPPPGERFCTREYAPVCAQRRGDRETFSNACEARRAGYRIIRDGECRGSAWPGPGPGPGYPPPRPGNVACTMQYDPVCARRGRDVRTFGNACSADAEGYRVMSRGECR